MIELKLKYTILSLIILVGCSTQNFNKKIETLDVDLLTDESFMRYNTNRLDLVDKSEKNTIIKAAAACHQDKFRKGQSLLESEMHVNKSNPFYWNALGTCYSLSQDYSKAIFFYELGLEAMSTLNGPNKIISESIITNNIGLIHLHFKRFNEAFDSFTKSSTLLPNSLTPKFNLAQLYIEFNQDDKALDILTKLESKNPDDVDLLYSLSLIYSRQNDYNKSFLKISKIKNNYLNRPDIVGLYAFNLMKKNRYIEAQQILEKRLYADEYNSRNKILLEEITSKLKEQSK
jgi:tetratricopeptide (TPR) repeat protein